MRFLNLLAISAFCGVSGFGATITCLTDDSSQCSTVASQISISTSGANLTIANTAGFSSAIDEIYFDASPDGLITGILIGSHTGTVDFAADGNPPSLPSGNNAVPVFDTDFRIGATSNNNRIDAGESLTVSATGGNLADLFNAGSVRLGLHVQSIGAPTGTSDALVVTGSAVPE